MDRGQKILLAGLVVVGVLIGLLLVAFSGVEQRLTSLERATVTYHVTPTAFELSPTATPSATVSPTRAPFRRSIQSTVSPTVAR